MGSVKRALLEDFDAADRLRETPDAKLTAEQREQKEIAFIECEYCEDYIYDTMDEIILAAETGHTESTCSYCEHVMTKDD